LTTPPSRRGPARGRRRRSWATTPRIPRPPVVAPVPAAGAGGGAHPTRRAHPACSLAARGSSLPVIHALPSPRSMRFPFLWACFPLKSTMRSMRYGTDGDAEGAHTTRGAHGAHRIRFQENRQGEFGNISADP
jgi:hypothetical protein